MHRADLDLASGVASGLEAALAARAPAFHASTPMVRQLASRVGDRLLLGPEALGLLDIAARIRDIGMVALPDSVALAAGPLTPEDWVLVNRHPTIGAELVEQLPSIAPVADVVRSHHERWDGAGYPTGQRRDAIPLASRVIAACDAFVAMATDRPHRRGVGSEAALEHVVHQRDAQFDPKVVDALVEVLAGASAPSESRRPARRRRDIAGVIDELDILPAFTPAYERVLAATEGGEVVAAIESDTGLTLAVLGRARTVAAGRPITNVPDAVAGLGVAEVRRAIEPLRRAAFPGRTTQLEVLMHRSRVHAHGVVRAAVPIAHRTKLADDVVVVALLHDVGKLVLGLLDPEYSSTSNVSTATPEERMKRERRTYGLDHAALGGLLAQRWGLPALAGAIAAHHSASEADDVAAYTRLADMVVHHALGGAVDRKTMLRLANACGLSAAELRDVLFDLPHSAGSDRRRAQPSPLTGRETTVLQLLAQGKVTKVIAAEVGLSTATVRTHLHNSYAKLAVVDRAQAVLKATEMGWI